MPRVADAAETLSSCITYATSGVARAGESVLSNGVCLSCRVSNGHYYCSAVAL